MAESKYAANDVTNENLVSRIKAELVDFGENPAKYEFYFSPGYLTIKCPDKTVESFAGKTAIEIYDKFMDRCYDVNIIVLKK